jgi:hypothetical protein
MCVISTMFGCCFWFFKKTFLFKQLLVPPPRPVLHISHSGSLTVDPPRLVLHISHFGSLTCQSPPPSPQNPMPPSCLQRWARGNTKPPSQALSLTNWQCKRRPRRHVQDSVSLSVCPGRLNTKTTPCSHGFKIYRLGQIDRLTELIYKIGIKEIVVMLVYLHHKITCNLRLLPT